jgi:hypothetical protein
LKGNKIFAVDVLNKELLQKAISLGADIIVSNERKCDTSDYNNIEFVNSEVYRIPGTYEAYKYNTAIIEKLYRKHAEKFVVNGLNIRKAIPKMVYWTNYKTGYLHACIKDVLKGAQLVYITPYLSGNKFKEILKYFKHYTSNTIKYFLKKNRLDVPKVEGRKIGLLVNDEFEMGIFEYLVKAIPADDLVIFNYGNIDFEKFGFIGKNIMTVNINVIFKYSMQPFINPFSLSAQELAVTNTITWDWQGISKEIEQYKFMKDTSVQSVIINVGENLPGRNLMLDVFEGRKGVYNTMNGIKSGEAHDGDVFFTKWFVWDEKMKNLLTSKCGLAPDTLAVTGHLMKDFLKDFVYRDTLGIPMEKLKDKKVISLFSVRGDREEKLEAFAYLLDLLEKDDSYFLLVRRHPLEKSGVEMPGGKPLKNVHFVTYDLNNSKQTLYEQIYLSDIGIVFGSTVAIECQWMNVPVITFEKRETSNVYCVDQEKIRHVRSIEALENIVRTVQKKQRKDMHEDGTSVAEKMIDILKHDKYK